MLTNEQYKTIEKVLAIPASAIRKTTPSQYIAFLQNALDAFAATENVQSNESDTLAAAFDSFQILQLTVNVLKIIAEQIELVREFTPEENSLMAELDRVIGRVSHRMARLVAGLRKFESMGKEKSVN